MKPTIIVAGYKREKSIARLLRSLQNSIYPSNDISIIISLDGGYSPEVYDTCQLFAKNFKHGNVEIVCRSKNIGLRNHILWCGDQTSLTGSIVLLEDDLYVDPQFYLYAIAAAKFYENDDRIGGIALYSQEYNEYAQLPFKALKSNYTNYFMQVACSWGQLWTKKQWKLFKNWYADQSKESIELNIKIPKMVSHWPESSWKKYFSTYLASNNKYFVYPYNSYTTNASDPGGNHLQHGSNLFQTSMVLSERNLDTFNFATIDSNDIILYDSHMETMSPIIYESLAIDASNIEIDIYGTKSSDLLLRKKYALTTKKVKNPIYEFDLSFRPIENSILHRENNGNGVKIALIETRSISNVSFSNDYIHQAIFLSGINLMSRKLVISLLKASFKKAINKIL